MNTNKLIFDFNRPIYAKDKEDGKLYLVDAVFFPLGKPSEKDVVIIAGEDNTEWRSIDEVELLQDE